MIFVLYYLYIIMIIIIGRRCNGGCSRYNRCGARHVWYCSRRCPSRFMMATNRERYDRPDHVWLVLRKIKIKIFKNIFGEYNIIIYNIQRIGRCIHINAIDARAARLSDWFVVHDGRTYRARTLIVKTEKEKTSVSSLSWCRRCSPRWKNMTL